MKLGLFLSVLLISSISFGQCDTIVPSQIANSPIIGFYSIRFDFSDGEFNYRIEAPLNQYTKMEGSYSISGDTLLLNYKTEFPDSILSMMESNYGLVNGSQGINKNKVFILPKKLFYRNKKFFQVDERGKINRRLKCLGFGKLKYYYECPDWGNVSF